MKRKGSLSYSKDPVTGPYHEPDKSFHPIPISYILLLCSYLCLELPQVGGWSTGLATLSCKKFDRYKNLNNCKVVEALCSSGNKED
jgi:hypothetical protein